MRKFSLCFLLCMAWTANSFAATSSASRTISPKNRGGDIQSENIVSKNRVVRENNSLRNMSRAVTESDKTKNTNVISRSVSQNQNVVTRGGQKNVARSAADNNQNVITRATRQDIANNTPRRAHTVSRSMPDVSERTRQVDSENRDDMRSVQERAVSITTSKKQITPTAESIAAAKDVLEKTADLNSTCQQQYNDCMDQFCAVVDANQKRCSCSENLAKYAKVQQAVEDANAELNDVAQNIRYLGLSADEIRAIMNATEAELELTKAKDTSQTRSMLDDIADMIKDPTSTKTLSYSESGDSLLDMDLDFSSDASNLFGLDLFSTSNDISSKRGKDLYREATKRCKTVLTQCKDAGATESQISGNYDLAISKDCAAYEQGLANLNQKLVSNVRSANLMLQKGRLTVLQNKNQYDVRGCIGALENCMLDDMVCGEGYLKCLDPTKKYMDENGNVVLGHDISQITKSMENYDNTNINANFVQTSMNDTTCTNGDGACVVNYLMTKIGTGQSARDGGLCRAVLDKCQDYTYNTNNKNSVYKPYNDVVVNYIQRAMINIKAAQSQLISDYASTCLADVSDCYNQQVSQINSLSTTANVDSVYKVMTGACYNVALTCGYAVFAYDANIQAITNEETKKAALIESVSELFYESLLCPSNSTFDITGVATADPNRTIGGYANTHCKCNDGYTVWGGACLAKCSDTDYRNALGSCVSCPEGSTAARASNTANPGASVENSSCSNQSE